MSKMRRGRCDDDKAMWKDDGGRRKMGVGERGDMQQRHLVFFRAYRC